MAENNDVVLMMENNSMVLIVPATYQGRFLEIIEEEEERDEPYTVPELAEYLERFSIPHLVVTIEDREIKVV